MKEAESNVKSYLADGLLKKQEFRKVVYDTYIRNSRESLILAKKIFDEGSSNLWVVVISYYSMFYIANAVLYHLGYKVGDKIVHKVASDALIVFVRDKLKDSLIEDYDIAAAEALTLSDNMLKDYAYESRKRSIFQYETTEEIKKAKAKTSLERAERFVAEIEKVMM